jgi:hypothetical protein
MRRILNPSVQSSHRITPEEDDTNSDWGGVLAERPPEQTPARRLLGVLIRWFPTDSHESVTALHDGDSS